MTGRDDLLNSLVSDLKPAPPANLRLRVGLWLLLSAVYVVAITHLLGPIRPTAVEQLLSYPRFLGEMIVGGLFAIGLGVIAFRSAVPGGAGAALIVWVAAAGVLWLGSLLVGLAFPALEPSMLGKRDLCFAETFLYALPPAALAIYLQRRLYPLTPARSAALAGLAAGALPALYMQLACMYAPDHVLLFHVLPGAAVAIVASLAPAALRKLGPHRP